MNQDKILFVIPAYNEELNIVKVIDEIKNLDINPDIVIINDCSKDNTSKIVKEKGVACIDMPFNVGYAMAIQTGLKYATEFDYDYVVQFDADGQHIAEEAKKLITKIKEKELDIVIGSRFTKNNEYKQSFARRLGGKIFSGLINLFCRQKITDPTSGFQVLTKEVYKKYAKMGGYPEYPDANLIIEMLLAGYKIGEVGVKMRQREFGESMHKGIIKPIKYMINMFYEIIVIFVINIFNRKEKRV